MVSSNSVSWPGVGALGPGVASVWCCATDEGILSRDILAMDGIGTRGSGKAEGMEKCTLNAFSPAGLHFLHNCVPSTSTMII